MRILVVAQYFPPRRSSFASRWAWLTTELAQRGHDIDIVALMGSTRQLGNLRRSIEADPPVPGVVAHPVLPVFQSRRLVPRTINELLEGLRAFITAMRVTRPDVVVASVPAIVALPVGWAVARLRRRPFVLDLRDAWPELLDDWREWNDDGQRAKRPLHPVKQAAFPIAARLVGRVIGALRANADAIVVTTETFAARLRTQRMARVRLIRNTSVKPWTTALPTPPARSDELRVLYMGNVGRAQLLATAVRAAALAQRRGVRLTLRIVGAGPQWAAARKIAREENAPVEFHDRIPTHQVLTHYEWADTVLVTLRDWTALRDTVPSKLYEIFLTGRHVTASVAGETANLVERYEAGTVVPPEDVDALAQLWADLASDRTRLAMPTKARVWVMDSLSAVRLGDAFESVLTEVTGAQGT